MADDSHLAMPLSVSPFHDAPTQSSPTSSSVAPSSLSVSPSRPCFSGRGSPRGQLRRRHRHRLRREGRTLVRSPQRNLARHFLADDIEDPDDFIAARGLFAWLQCGAPGQDRLEGDRRTSGQRHLDAVQHLVRDQPLVGCGRVPRLPALRAGRRPTRRSTASTPTCFVPGSSRSAASGVIHGAFIMATGVVLFFVAPWPMRLACYVDRRLIHWLLGPDVVAARMRSLEGSEGKHG